VIDHVDLVVGDLERSLTSYRRLLAPLSSGEPGERVVFGLKLEIVHRP
jgi:catechol 2,3-dioxygenase-like lactoylglutathione lyase family enzyme